MHIQDIKLAVIGLGYVGLPLAVEFAKTRKVVGFDINKKRISNLKIGKDETLEVSNQELSKIKSLSFLDTVNKLKQERINFYIVTVPTPVDEHKSPDLTPLINATKMVGSILKAGDIVVYESTVYPGATEEICIPILEKSSNLKYNIGFFVGYSPERINPGDKKHRIHNIKKIVSGSNPYSADLINKLYQTIVTAGTHLAPSIKVAEAAKVIENTQRDLNIALMNELSIIFGKLNIDTSAVLEAAGTKWNFMPFKPGLVGGHCIGVDPYYLTYKAQSVGYYPEIILAGRRLNDAMSTHVIANLVKSMSGKKIHIHGARILVMGLTFKENCPDLRNSKVFDLISELHAYNCSVDVYDPWIISDDMDHKPNFSLIEKIKTDTYDGILIAVAHDVFKKIPANTCRSWGKKNVVIYDLKAILPLQDVDLRL